jgi:cell division transport system permease protein
MFEGFKRIIRYGLINFKRQSGLNFATVFILTITLSLVSFLFISQGAIKFLTEQIQKKIDISIYINPDAKAEDVSKIKAELEKMPEVKEISYLSSKEALEKFKLRHKDDPVIMESLEVVGENPFYPALNIRAKNPEYYATILAFLNKEAFQDIIHKVDYTKKKKVIDKLFSLTSNINKFGISLSIALGVIALLIAFNTIREGIKESSEEISIMRLVGAPNFFVRGPFLVQGVIVGLLSSLATFLIFFLASYFLTSKIELVTNGFNLFSWFGKHSLPLFLVQLTLGIGLAVLSSLAAIRKYLKT